ncbi:hypothetical protein HK099_000170 [Clydaea vesicula]|uniref:mRNA stability protein n=1 Tax=Clydaea vesicula TaxID=447962 RepID=A0AAD5TVN0_9FUNG|nr:hypothetical protein HK099_000170 [Clydaea vesicula]KAJ3391812.1 hypothetical protein HDU92_008778 [Lobulomyces angularis]
MSSKAALSPADIEKLTDEQRAFYQKWGKLPPAKKDVLSARMKGSDRKFFDSGDYAMSQAGKASSKDIGSNHPTPEQIPHSHPTNKKNGEISNSPAKESSLIHEANFNNVSVERET